MAGDCVYYLYKAPISQKFRETFLGQQANKTHHHIFYMDNTAWWQWISLTVGPPAPRDNGVFVCKWENSAVSCNLSHTHIHTNCQDGRLRSISFTFAPPPKCFFACYLYSVYCPVFLLSILVFVRSSVPYPVIPIKVCDWLWTFQQQSWRKVRL